MSNRVEAAVGKLFHSFESLDDFWKFLYNDMITNPQKWEVRMSRGGGRRVGVSRDFDDQGEFNRILKIKKVNGGYYVTMPFHKKISNRKLCRRMNRMVRKSKPTEEDRGDLDDQLRQLKIMVWGEK